MANSMGRVKGEFAPVPVARKSKTGGTKPEPRPLEKSGEKPPVEIKGTIPANKPVKPNPEPNPEPPEPKKDTEKAKDPATPKDPNENGNPALPPRNAGAGSDD